MSGRDRVYYRKSSGEIVVEKDGRELAVYPSTEALVETHIKGILAKDHRDLAQVRDIMRKYRPADRKH
ncbi:MAG: hypothetical protein ISP91_11030 [Pseudomonadales bacterium]|nr:hypothetical protein [Pseudomonadales bacterium]